MTRTRKVTSGASPAPEREQIPYALPDGYVLNDYIIDYAIGKGGFGITYRAHRKDTGKVVVIKENFPEGVAMRCANTYRVCAVPRTDKEDLFNWAQIHFSEEAAILTQLEHPNIVRVLDYFKELDTAYYVMEPVPGAELDTALGEYGEPDETWIRLILSKLLSALQYMHSHTPSVLHRDIKPANIMLNVGGSPVLIDFGLARKNQKISQVIAGSHDYTPFEQLTGKSEKQGPWTDIYSLGATCYRLITGDVPANSVGRLAEYKEGKQDCYIPLVDRKELKGRFSPDFLSSIDKALQIFPADRWQSADEWLAAIGQEAPTRPAQSSSGKAIWVTLVILLTIACGFLSYQNYLSPPSVANPTPIELNEAQDKIKTLETQLTETNQELTQAREKIKTLVNSGSSALVTELRNELAQAQKNTESLKNQVTATNQELAQAEKNAEALKKQIAASKEEQEKLKTAQSDLTRKLEIEEKLSSPDSVIPPEQAAAALSDMHIEPQNYDSQLCTAAAQGNERLLRLLIAAGANINNHESNYGRTPLHLAAGGGHTKCVSLLLAAPGIEVNQGDTHQEHVTPLSYAISHNRVSCVKLLLEDARVDKNLPTAVSKDTPLHIAAKYDSVECAALLLCDNSVKKHTKNNAGNTPKDCAAGKQADGSTRKCTKLFNAYIPK